MASADKSKNDDKKAAGGEKGENNKDRQLQSIRIRALENGYVVTIESRLTDAAMRKRSMAKKSSPLVMGDNYRSEEYGATTVDDVLKRVKEELTEYSPVSAFDNAFEEDGD